MMKKINRKLAVFVVALMFSVNTLRAQRITVSGSRFTVGGREIWLNGANTPWHSWNDFGTGNYDHDWWKGHMQTLKADGINCIRIWISCDGGGIRINPDGTVTGVTASFFGDLDRFFALAQSHKIYILATLLSFDHTKSENPNHQAFRACFTDKGKTGTLVDSYVVPFVNRYKENPYLFAIDACNEIEWIHEKTEAGSIAWERLQYLAARMAAGVHANSLVLFTMGSAAVKWNSDNPGCEGNKWKESALQAQLNDPKAFLDFYSPHWYGWVVRWFGNPCATSPSGYGIGGRPCIVGECPARGMFFQDPQGEDILVNPPSEMYEKAFQEGWRGVFPWTSNGVDDNGSIADFGAATRAFRDIHPDLVDPAGTGVGSAHSRPSEPSCFSCYPNPFNGQTTIRYRLDRPEHVLVHILDVKGKEQRMLFKGWQSQGIFNLYWDGCDDLGTILSSGVYLCLLNAGHERLAIKALLVE